MNDYLQFAKQLALDAGEIMLKHFHAAVSVREKEDKSIVTVADEEVNQLVIARVAEVYPEYSVFGEEDSADKKSEYAWVVDPIDGTIPYAKGMPVSVFSLALVKDGQPIIGVVYDPFMKRLYSAAQGEGAFLNDEPIHVSDKDLERHSIVNIEWWSDAPYDVDTVMHNVSVETKIHVHHLGSIIGAACYVAAGRYEACVFPGVTGKNVDVAAVKVIVEEAGGKVTDLFGNEQRYDAENGDINGALITNGKIHDALAVRLARDLKSAA
ncbi:MAG: inositol monophosphatase family protein [Candidatus Saccharimonadales bacterium]